MFVTVDQRGEGLRKGEKAITHKQAHRAVSLFVCWRHKKDNSLTPQTLHKCESVQERFRERELTCGFAWKASPCIYNSRLTV